MMTSAMQLYFTGESFRNVKQFLKLHGVKMSHIYKWLPNESLKIIHQGILTTWKNFGIDINGISAL